MLVAPLTVGAAATVGAGSTITKSVPRGGLTLERSTQKSYAHWSRPSKATIEERASTIARSELKDDADPTA